VLVLLVTALAPPSSFAEQKNNIEGAWLVSVTGAGIPAWYRALATFTRDGNLIQTVTDSAISTGHGQWTNTHGRQFAITTLLLQFDTTGDFIGTLKARATLKLDKTGNVFTSEEYLFESFDRDGNLLASGTGTAHGTRIVVDPLP
jgi:hypothetical protein